MKNDETRLDESAPENSQSHRELLDQLANQEAQLQIKSQLMDNMAYQIRTLSNAVIGFSDLLLLEGLTQDQIEYVQEINSAGHGLSALVNEVLDWAQLLSGKLAIKKSLCELSEIIQRLEEMLSVSVKEKGLDYRVVTDPMLPACIRTDDERLLRCLLNLIANAVRCTAQGAVEIHISLAEGGLEPGIRFDVIDNGAGIDDKKADDIFKPGESNQGFFTLLDMGFKVTAGLPQTKQLAEFLGGTVEVQGQAGVGSTFSLSIPVGTDLASQPKLEMTTPSESTPVPSCDWQPTPTSMPSQTVLLVEDQQSNRTVISLMLESLGVDVETAVDGEESLQKVQNTPYALILMDLKMPKMDGYEATRRLRDRGVEVPVVALSAKVLSNEAHDEIASLFDGFLTKPVDSRKLYEVIQKYIRGLTLPDRKKHSDDPNVVVLEYGE